RCASASSPPGRERTSMSTTDLESYLAELRILHAKRRPAHIPDHVVYPAGEITIPAHVSHWARERGDAVALVFEGRELTYRELDDAHRRLAGWLAAQGIGRGDRVAVYLGNSPEFVIAFLAILRLGAVHVPVNPMFAPAELAHELGDSEPSLIMTNEQLAPAVAEIEGRLG